MPPIIVRAATLNDLPELTRLWHEKMVLQQQFDHRLSLAPDAANQWSAAVSDWLEDPDCKMVIALRDSDTHTLAYAVGWVKRAPPGLLTRHIGYITDIAVDAHRQQSGVSGLLLAALKSWFAGRDVQQMVAYVPHRGAVEQAFWRAQGASEWIDLMWIK